MSETFDADAAGAWMQRFFAAFDLQEQALTELDRASGDGDFGANLRSALNRARKNLQDASPTTPGEVLDQVSLAFLNTGGTSGPLFGMWFRELGKALTAPEAGVAEIAAGVRAGAATVQRLGGARPGDKTMVDALVPAADALGGADGSWADGLAAAASAARAGAEATRDLTANRGRASYVGEVARGVLDPGAVTVALLFESAAG